jgi:hypothetical protein
VFYSRRTGTVYLNNGRGVFTQGGGIANLVYGALTLGDVDGDGDGDLDAVNGMVRLNDGHGNFYGTAVFHLAVTNTTTCRPCGEPR